MLTIWGRANSLNVQKVMWCLAELGVPCRRIDVGMQYGGNDTPEFLAKNPNGRVPVLEEESGFTLWESNTIVRYLAAKHGAGRLWPADPARRADSERWMDWQITTVDRPLFTVFWGLVRSPAEKRDMKAIEAARDALGDLWKIADARLADRPYLGGDTLTIGDIPLGAVAHRWFNLPIDLPSCPNVEGWYKRLGERAPYRSHVMLPLS
jgi:glutathione S-transferase